MCGDRKKVVERKCMKTDTNYPLRLSTDNIQHDNIWLHYLTSSSTWSILAYKCSRHIMHNRREKSENFLNRKLTTIFASEKKLLAVIYSPTWIIYCKVIYLNHFLYCRHLKYLDIDFFIKLNQFWAMNKEHIKKNIKQSFRLFKTVNIATIAT